MRQPEQHKEEKSTSSKLVKDTDSLFPGAAQGKRFGKNLDEETFADKGYQINVYMYKYIYNLRQLYVISLF